MKNIQFETLKKYLFGICLRRHDNNVTDVYDPLTPNGELIMKNNIIKLIHNNIIENDYGILDESVQTYDTNIKTHVIVKACPY